MDGLPGVAGPGGSVSGESVSAAAAPARPGSIANPLSRVAVATLPTVTSREPRAQPPALAPLSATHAATPQTVAQRGPAGPTLNKVQAWFCKKLGSIFPGLRRMLDEHTANMSTQTQRLTGRSAEAVAVHTGMAVPSDVPGNPSTPFLRLPPELMLRPDELSETAGGHRMIASEAVRTETHLRAPTVDSGVGQMVGTRFIHRPRADGTPNTVMVEGVVTPTSYILGPAGALQKSHLTNTYSIMVDGKPYAVVRSGVIDTRQKADELVLLLTKIRNEIAQSTGNPNFRLRVVSQQLNSFEEKKEAKMINAQHRWIAHANRELNSALSNVFEYLRLILQQL